MIVDCSDIWIPTDKLTLKKRQVKYYMRTMLLQISMYIRAIWSESYVVRLYVESEFIDLKGDGVTLKSD